MNIELFYNLVINQKAEKVFFPKMKAGYIRGNDKLNLFHIFRTKLSRILTLLIEKGFYL